MLGRQSVRVTYSHKRRRFQDASKRPPMSSPLEVLPPDVHDLTRTQMARRMLKRSRRVALAEQLEDRNVDHIREHLAKRIKRTEERASNVEGRDLTFDGHAQDDLTFQTPFCASQSVHELTVPKSPPLEPLSPVPAKPVVSRTSSRDLKENSTLPQTLASPFSSRPGSAAPSPKHKGGGRSSRRVSRISLHTKSRTLSGVFKENTRRVSRKGSTTSLRNAKRDPSARLVNHKRCPSSPSTAYMHSQVSEKDWIAPPKAFSRTFEDSDELPSPGGSFSSNNSFYADQPQSCSTPALSRLRKPSDARTDSLLDSFSPHEDTCDVEMMDDTEHPRRQTIHLSGNSIFSSSDEFTIGSHRDGMALKRNSATTRDEASSSVVRQAPPDRVVLNGSHSLTGSFVAEYDIPLHDLDHSPVSIVASKVLSAEGMRKSSVGKKSFGLPGTSPARGENLVIHKCRNSAVPRSSVGELVSLPGTSPALGENSPTTRIFKDAFKSSVGEQLLGLPGTSPACGRKPIIQTSTNHGTATPPASPPNMCPPSSPASELASDLQSMDISGHPDTHSDGEVRHVAAPVPLQTHSRSLRDVPAELSAKKSVKRRHVRNRASTIRASDFTKPSPLSGTAAGLSVPSSCNVRRTRSGTIVGPDSKLAAKGATLPVQTTKPAPRLAAVQSGSEPESDDELLLKGFWMEDIEYLGLAVPGGRKEAEADELNLGGLWHGLEFPPRRMGLRKR